MVDKNMSIGAITNYKIEQQTSSFSQNVSAMKKELDMKKSDADTPIKIVTVNQPTKEQAEKRIKKLSEYLGKIWNDPKNIKQFSTPAIVAHNHKKANCTKNNQIKLFVNMQKNDK